MLGETWYHGTIRRYVIVFGSLFNDIDIHRAEVPGKAPRSMRVPLSYGPKERYLTRQFQNPDLLRPVSLVYPRMAFEIINFRYAPDRKLNSYGRSTAGSSKAGSLHVQYNPVPYDIDFRLTIITRNTDDALRIVEQIIPMFTPVLNVSAELIPDMHYPATTLPITLERVEQQELYEDSFTTREYVIWSLDFTMKAYLYGPTHDSKVIKEINVNFHIPDGQITSASIANSSRQEHIYVRPGLTADGQPTTNVAASVNVSQISANSNYDFIIDFERDINDNP
jgi:hypothetical protein